MGYYFNSFNPVLFHLQFSKEQVYALNKYCKPFRGGEVEGGETQLEISSEKTIWIQQIFLPYL